MRVPAMRWLRCWRQQPERYPSKPNPLSLLSVLTSAERGDDWGLCLSESIIITQSIKMLCLLICIKIYCAPDISRIWKIYISQIHHLCYVSYYSSQELVNQRLDKIWNKKASVSRKVHGRFRRYNTLSRRKCTIWLWRSRVNNLFPPETPRRNNWSKTQNWGAKGGMILDFYAMLCSISSMRMHLSSHSLFSHFSWEVRYVGCHIQGIFFTGTPLKT